MTMFRSILLCCLLLTVLFCGGTEGVRFQLKAGEETCLSEMVNEGQQVSGDFTVVPGQSRVSIRVLDPKGALVYHRQRMTDGRFTHVSPANGDYSVCFNNAKGFDTKTVTFNFKKGIAAMTAEEVEDLAKTEHLKPVEQVLRRLERTSAGIRRELESWRVREKKLKAVNDSTSNQVMWFGVVTMLILIVAAALQMVYLKRFFLRQKLIHE